MCVYQECGVCVSVGEVTMKRLEWSKTLEYVIPKSQREEKVGGVPTDKFKKRRSGKSSVSSLSQNAAHTYIGLCSP